MTGFWLILIGFIVVGYGIAFTRIPEGTGSKIEVGCHSKFFQIAPLVTRAHDACEAAIQGALSLPQARIA